MHSVIIACTITTLITTYIYIASFKVQLSQQLHCSVSYRWGYCNSDVDGRATADESSGCRRSDDQVHHLRQRSLMRIPGTRVFLLQHECETRSQAGYS